MISIDKIKELILSNKGLAIRYCFLSILFIFLLLLTKTITDPLAKESPDYNNIYNSSVYSVNPDQNEIIIDKYPLKAGSTYRIVIYLESLSLDNNNSPENLSLSLLTKDLNEEKIKDIKLDKNKTVPFEIVISPDQDISNIILRRTGYSNSNLRIKDMDVSSISPNPTLAPTVINSIDYQKVIADTTKADQSYTYYDLTKKNVLVGEIFQANSEYVDGASFKLNFLGNGGAYGHTVVLREAIKNPDGTFTVDNKDLDTYSFRTQFAKDHLITINTADIYRFPLNSAVTPGHFYFAGFDNTAIVNSQNHIQIAMVKNDGESGFSFHKGGGKTSLLGDFYFKAFGDNLPNSDLPNGVIISDSGDGTGRYLYRGEFDIFNSAIAQRTQNETEYKFVTPDEILNLNIELNYIDNNASYYYSADGKIWTRITNDMFLGREILLKNLRVTKSIYLKATDGSGTMLTQAVVSATANLKLK